MYQGRKSRRAAAMARCRHGAVPPHEARMIDMVLLAVILVSALLGALRGFVGIVVGTLSWLLAGWATFQFGGSVGRWLADGAHPGMTFYLGGYALTFVVTMAVVGIIGMVIRSAVRATALSGTDRPRARLRPGHAARRLLRRGAGIADELHSAYPRTGLAPVGGVAGAQPGRVLDARAVTELAHVADAATEHVADEPATDEHAADGFG